MNAREWLNLVADRERVEALWRAEQSTYVSMALATSFILHQLNTDPVAVAAFSDYDYSNMLNVIAAALSALVPAYQEVDGGARLVPLSMDPVRYRFGNGATALYGMDGTRVMGIVVERVDVLSALPAIERADLMLLPLQRRKSASSDPGGDG